MRRILRTLCGTMVLVLLALSPGYAGPFYQSDLVCLPQFEDRGVTVIKKPSGDLYVQVTTDPPVPHEPFECQITCDPPVGTLGPAPCGKSNASGILQHIVYGLGKVAECRNPSVQVFNFTVACESGYPTPQ